MFKFETFHFSFSVFGMLTISFSVQVRIAATLGGFFGLMVLLVVYKSKCKSRSLSDEHLEAAVAAAVIEEEEELALNALSLYGPRRSLGNMSAPIGIYPRFSSLGGYGLLNPPVKLCYGQRARVSLPVVETKLTPRLTLTSASPKRAYEEVTFTYKLYSIVKF